MEETANKAVDAPTDGTKPAPVDDDRQRTLDAVVVTATRSPTRLVDVPASVTVKKFDDVRKMGYIAPGDEFRTVPGVSFRQGEGDFGDHLAINFRGVTGNHGNDTFLGLVDGIPFLTPDEEVGLTQVPYGAVSRIEFVRGPISALYGRGALGGAVNYITRTPDKSGVTVEGSVGSYGYGRGALGATYVGNTVKNLFNAEYETANGWRHNNRHHSLSLFDKAVFEIGPKATMTVWGAHTNLDYDLGGTIPTTPDGQLVAVTNGRKAYLGVPGAGRHLDNWLLAGRLEYQLTDNLEWSTTASWRREKTGGTLNFPDPGHYDLATDTVSVIEFDQTKIARTQYLESVLRWNTERSTLTAGATYERATLDDHEGYGGYFGFSLATYQFYFYANPINYMTGEFLPVPGLSRASGEVVHSNTVQNNLGVFVQEEWRATDRLTLTLGGRYDHFKRDAGFRYPLPDNDRERVIGSAGRFTPKASVSWKFDPGLLYVTYGQGYSANFAETWQWDPRLYSRSQRVRPSTLDSVELGWKGWGLDDRLKYSLAMFDVRQKDRLIFFSPNDGQPGIATNGPPYSSHGLEASASFRVTPNTALSGYYSYVRAKYGDSAQYRNQRLRDPALDDVAGRRPVGVPAHNASLRLDQKFLGDAVDLGVMWEYHGDYPISIDNNRRGGAFNLVNLGVTVRPPGSPKLEFEASVSNALNKSYNYYYGQATDVAYAVPGGPRQARLTFRYRF